MAALVDRVTAAIGPSAQVKVGVETAGHYQRPVLDYRWQAGWDVLELNPAQVAEQRRVAGRRRIKTDAIDLEAITELVLAGRGQPVVAAGPDRRLGGPPQPPGRVGTATKNQLLGQLGRTFPGLGTALPDVLGTKIGRLIAAELADPAQLAALAASRFIRFAAAHDVQRATRHHGRLRTLSPRKPLRYSSPAKCLPASIMEPSRSPIMPCRTGTFAYLHTPTPAIP
jgi:transposase